MVARSTAGLLTAACEAYAWGARSCRDRPRRLRCKDRFNGRVHAREVGGTARLQNAIEADWVRERSGTVGRNDPEAQQLQNLKREKSAVHPSAEPQGFGRKKDILADCCGFAEGKVAGLALEQRQWQRILGIEKAALQPWLGAGRPEAMPVIHDLGTAIPVSKAPERRIDELRNQRN